MLCVDVAPADGASIQQTLKLLEEKLKSVGKQNISAFNLHTLIILSLKQNSGEKEGNN